jgi:uncharacterized DUF497 family protein
MHSLRIEQFRWPRGIEEKVLRKHGLFPDQVEESFFHPEGRLRKEGERYRLLSRTYSGDYILVIFEYSLRVATVISARYMTDTEKRLFRRK